MHFHSASSSLHAVPNKPFVFIVCSDSSMSELLFYAINPRRAFFKKKVIILYHSNKMIPNIYMFIPVMIIDLLKS